MKMTENMGEEITVTVKELTFKYVVSKNEDGNFQAIVVDFPEVVLTWAYDESDEVHKELCERSMYNGIKVCLKKSNEDAETHES